MYVRVCTRTLISGIIDLFMSDREMYWILTKHEMQQITGENSSDSDLILYCILTWFCEHM